MNRKSRNIDTSCGSHALGNVLNDKVMKNYFKVVKSYIIDDFSDKTPYVATINDLKSMAEQEFTSYYGAYPTCAVFAPGSLTISGKNTNPVESKSLSMAVQLFIVVVGKRNHSSKWCYIKTLSDEIVGRKVFNFYLNTETLNLSVEDASWMRFVKATIQSFKAKKVHIPGFKIVIASNVPMKRGLGSSSALVVALYTFLEAITNTYTGNVLEKALACHLAEKLAAYPCSVRIGDILTSVVGNEDKIFAIDATSLDVKEYDWDSIDVNFIFIECGDKESLKSCSDAKQRKEMLTLMNRTSRWRTHPSPDSMIQLLFSEDAIKMNNDIINEDNRIEKIIDTIREEKWEDLGTTHFVSKNHLDPSTVFCTIFSYRNIAGKLMGENHQSIRKYSDDIERIVNSLQCVEGVLGFSIIDRDYGASIVTLVRRSKIKNFISFWNRKNISQRYYIMKSCTGAATFYSYERRLLSSASDKYFISRLKFMNKYSLNNESCIKLEYFNKFEIMKTISFIIPYGSYGSYVEH